jgi:glutamyl-Q tRNA(Asp) synthetase
MHTRVFRFAPSPNGFLHLGHAYSALLNDEMARAMNGVLLLRIEDIDAARCRPQYAAAIIEDLRWLGISWQQDGVRRQSEHFGDYQAAVTRLEAMGLLYPSFESRSEIAALVAERDRAGHWPRDPDGVPFYPGRARKMSKAERDRRRRDGEPFALRLAMDAAVARAGALAWTENGIGPQSQAGVVVAAPQMWGDVVLARKEAPTSYHLAVAIDDALQGVTDIVRGQDLFWSTGIHRLLQALLGLPEPAYHHHQLILDAGGRKLSKSTLATSLRDLRATGATPADVRRMVGLVDRP